MRYVARKPRISPRRDDAATETGIDALSAWLPMIHVAEIVTSSTYENVKKAIINRGLNGFQVRAKMMSAHVLPCWKSHQDPYERLLACIVDDEVYKVAHTLLKAGRKSLSHQEALSYAPKMNDILPLVTEFSDIRHHLPSMMILLLSDIGDVRKSAEELSFTPSPEELSTRVGVDTRRTRVPLYPGVSKGNIATKESIARSYAQRHVTGSRKVERGNVFRPDAAVVTDTGSMMQRLRDNLVDMDEEAVELMMQGEDINAVIQFHEDVPEGYWEEVSKRMEAEEASFDSVYDALQPVFNFHPDDRELPSSRGQQEGDD